MGLIHTYLIIHYSYKLTDCHTLTRNIRSSIYLGNLHKWSGDRVEMMEVEEIKDGHN